MHAFHTTRRWGYLLVCVALTVTLAACADDDATSEDSVPGGAAETSGSPDGSTQEAPPTDSAPAPDDGASEGSDDSTQEESALDLEGIETLPGLGFNDRPTYEPARYHSARLGTEIVFDLGEPVTMGLHELGVIGFDDGAGDVLVVAQPDSTALVGADVPLLAGSDQVDVSGFVDALAAAGAAEVTEVETLDVDGRSTRVVDVTPVGDTDVSIVLGLAPGVASRTWIVDQGDITPVTITAPVQSDLAGVAAELVASLDLGPATSRPDIGSDEPWLFGQFTDANERVSGQVKLPVLDGVSVDLASDVTIPPFAGNAVDLVLEGAGTVPPSVVLEAPSEALTADSALPVAFETDGEIQTVDQLESLFSRVMTFGRTGSTDSVLGAEAASFDYVVGPAAVPLYLIPPNDFTNGEAIDLQPNTQGRVWLIDTERGPLVIRTQAEVRAPDDLAAATTLAEEVLASLILMP